MIKLLKRFLSSLGIIVFKRSSAVYLADDESYRIAVQLCGTKNPIIFDGGAHLGDSVIAFSAHAPLATFHCFEPDPYSVEKIRKKFSGQANIIIIEAALGEVPMIAQLNINASRPTNSLLSVSRKIPSSILSLCQPIEQVNVNVVSVDSYCDERGIAKVDILKLDLQGYDYKALLGSRQTLQGVIVVLTEVWFTEVYAEAELFPDILFLMKQHGFRLHTLCGLHYGERDELLWGDAIFVRSSVS